MGSKSFDLTAMAGVNSNRLNIRHIEKERKRLSLIQFPFYSAIGCLVPFLTAHMHDIGLTAKESAIINAVGGLVALLGPLMFGPIAHRFKKYTLLISVTLLLSTLCFTSLLFVPRVLRTPKHAQILFDCTNGHLLVEQCQNWNGNCDVHAKRLASGNFTNFNFYQCRYQCGPNANESAIPPGPIEVCFHSSSEETLCITSTDNLLRLSPSTPTPIMSSTSSYSEYSPSFAPLSDFKPLEAIQFDSRFDRWPLLDIRSAGSVPFCSFQPNEAIIIKSQTYQLITCRPSQPSCNIQCRVDMIHRAHSVMTSPLPCFRTTGNPKITFWSYLVARSVADFFLFTGFALLDALSITLTNDFDAIYGRTSKTFAIAFPLIFWPVGVGFLVDYFSAITLGPDYSPIFVIYNGLILITIIMLICFPVTPIVDSDQTPYTSLSQTSLAAIGSSNNSINKRSKKSIKEKSKSSSRHHLSDDDQPKMSLKSKFVLTSLMPFIIILSSFWGLLYTWLSAYYIELGVDKMWLGISTALGFVSFAPFALMVKSLTDGIGRVHLIVLGFVFYAIRLSGISFLHQPRWTLIPFQCMEAFTLPLAWIGVTSAVHHLVPSGSTTIHLWVHYILISLHFGVGRIIGSVGWWFWLKDWEENNSRWDWLIYDFPLIKIAANYNVSGYRLLLRLCAIVSACCAASILVFYHLCCRYRRSKKLSTSSCKKSRKDKKKTTGVTNIYEEGNNLLNGKHRIDDDGTSDDLKSSVKKSPQHQNGILVSDSNIDDTL